MENSDDEGRKWEPESGTEGLLVQTETARWGGASPIDQTRKLQIVLQKNSILNPYQKEFLRSQET